MHCLHECKSNPHFGHLPSLGIPPCKTVPHCAHRVIVLARKTSVSHPATVSRDVPSQPLPCLLRLSFGAGGELMFNRISHIGVVVSDIETALGIWRDQMNSV